MTAFLFPRSGERRNASAVPVPEDVLRDLVLSVLNGDINSVCPGCKTCDRWHTAAGRALLLLPHQERSHILLAGARASLDLLTLWGIT